jgi:GYF domain 2
VADQWYYTCDGQQWGPVSTVSLREMAAHGILQPTDLVWTAGMSQWAPASVTRGVFPTRAPTPVPARAPGPAIAGRDDSEEHQDDLASAYPIPELHRGSGIPNTTGRTVLIGGSVSVLALALLVAIAAVAKVADPAVNRSYPVSLNFEGQEDVRSLHFKQNEHIHITVTTHEWSGRGEPERAEPDVDLFVIDPEGNLVDQDIRPLKDCEVSFVAPQTGIYQIVVVLDSGSGVRCTVRY